jgi:hypothetical protein
MRNMVEGARRRKRNVRASQFNEQLRRTPPPPSFGRPPLPRSTGEDEEASVGRFGEAVTHRQVEQWNTLRYSALRESTRNAFVITGRATDLGFTRKRLSEGRSRQQPTSGSA